MAAPMCEIRSLDSLPTDPLLLILLSLDYKDVVSCCQTSCRLRELASHDLIWKRLCKLHWLKTCCQEGHTWLEEFVAMFREYGRYIDCYPRICKSWNQIESYMKTHLSDIHNSLQEGSTEVELDALEQCVGAQLPNDYRCSYRLHNGQQNPQNGLMGGVSHYNHLMSNALLSIDRAQSMIKANKEYWSGVVPVTECLYTPYCQLLALPGEHRVPKGQIFGEAVVTGGRALHDNFLKKDYFIIATSFEDLLCKYAQELEDDIFPRLNGQVYKFYYDPSSVATSHYIKVQCGTCFMPSVSVVNPPRFRHAYRITMSMDPDAPKSASCRLIWRHWEVEDGNGQRETVDGYGVVGEHPVMYPGGTFSWISGTFFEATAGKMWGHFIMHKLYSDEEVEVQCPVFHMKSLPYLPCEERSLSSAGRQQ